MRKSPREKTWWESIFPKLVAAFMIIIVPIIAAGVWLNMESEKIVRDQAFSLTWEQMEGNLDKFDSQVNTILNLQRYFCNNNSDMRTLANLPEAFSIVERAKAIQRINEQFTQIKLVSSFVADVRVHLRQIEKTISSYNRNLLGGLYRENPVKSRNYEAVKSSKKWENVGNSYIIPALLLYRYSYI